MEGQEILKKSKVIKIDSQESWQHHISHANNKVVVHFSAFWCITSTLMNPLFEELASTYQDAVFLNLDVDEFKEIASKFEIKAMPTFVLLNGGTPVDKIIGGNPDEIKKRVHHFIHSAPSHK
ncbi:hypothetical protein PIB30_091880 [Stylosanthes scabra]|uniref:Thioredoxin n=1 Tax=Stylosanthes scabra TaxID=79078 RepID=A0ABU6SX22_9FABA|nr:hypothetical protein [Stylosanthes scabra]